MSERDIFKSLQGLINTLDARIEHKVNALIVKNLNVKWQILSINLAFAALITVALFYVNDRTIKSSITASMADYDKRLSGIERDIKVLIKVSNDKKKEDPVQSKQN